MGLKNFFPVRFYISTRVNVSCLIPSLFISNIPLLTIVNTPTLFKPFASISTKGQSITHIYFYQSLKKIKTLIISIN